MIYFDDILQSAYRISQSSDSVCINDGQLFKIAEKLKQKTASHFLVPSSFLPYERQLMFAFILGLSRFCYWQEDQKYCDEKVLESCYAEAIRAGIDILNPDVIRKLDADHYQRLLRSNKPCGLLFSQKRFEFICDGIDVLTHKYDGSILTFFKNCRYDAERMVNALVDDFVGFDDIHSYQTEAVFFLYRAQQMIYDFDCIYFSQTGKHFKKYENLILGANERTACALHRLGGIEYVPDLQKVILSGKEISSGSVWETQLRANAVAAVDKIKKMLYKITPKDKKVDNVEQVLWMLSQEGFNPKIPPHKTYTWFY